MRRTIGILALLAGIAACSKESSKTKIVVAVWSDLAVPSQLDTVRITFAGPAETHSVDFPLSATGVAGKSKLPVELELARADNSAAAFDVKAIGLLAKQEVVSQEAQLAFVPGETRVLTLYLWSACRGVVCGSGLTCAAGQCTQPIAVSSAGLPVYDPQKLPPPPDSAVVQISDASPDGSKPEANLGVDIAGTDVAVERTNGGLDTGILDSAGFDLPPDAGPGIADVPIGLDAQGTGGAGGRPGIDGPGTDGAGGAVAIDGGRDVAVSSTCPALSNPTSGTVSTSALTTGATATYTCLSGYTLLGSPTRACQRDGTWSGSAPTCVIKDCGALAAPTNGSVSAPTTTYGSTATYSCGAGYGPSGSSTRTCQADGTWSGTAPTCVIANCPALPGPVSGSVSAPTLTYGSTATYSCNPGYSLSGTATRTCQTDGTWSGTAPTCTSVDCGVLASPSNGSVSVPATVYNSTASYTCNAGYFLNGVATRTCQANGTWSDATPACVYVDCGAPPSLANGTFSAPVTTYTATATYSCSPGYSLSGAATRTCQSNGTWSGTTPTCVPKDCGAPAAPTNGTVSAPTTTFGATATYACNTYYSLSGAATQTCQADGSWSGTAPTCYVTCGASTGGDQWVRVADPPYQPIWPVIGAIGNSIYVDSTATYAFDTLACTWTTKANITPSRRYCAGGVINSKLYVAYGYNAAWYTDTSVYDPGSDQWSALASGAGQGRGYPGGVVLNNLLYVAGGTRNLTTSELNDLEAYNPATNSWSTLATFTTGRSRQAMAAVNGKLYMFGGQTPSTVLGDVQEYDPGANTWAAKASLPTARRLAAAAVYNNKIYVLGGIDPSGNYLTTNEEYNPATNTWATRASIPLTTSSGGATTYNGKIYYVGGEGTNTQIMYVYTPPAN